MAHVCPGRVRLRIPGRRRDKSYFESVVERLRTYEAAHAVSADPATAGMLVMHRGEFGDIVELARRDGLFSVSEVEPVGESALRTASASLRTVSSAVQNASGGVLDVPSLAYIGLVGLAVVQAVRGHVAGPATTLLWNALTLVQLGDLAKQVTRAVAQSAKP